MIQPFQFQYQDSLMPFKLRASQVGRISEQLFYLEILLERAQSSAKIEMAILDLFLILEMHGSRSFSPAAMSQFRFGFSRWVSEFRCISYRDDMNTFVSKLHAWLDSLFPLENSPSPAMRTYHLEP